jgi:hypothetical protein
VKRHEPDDCGVSDDPDDLAVGIRMSERTASQPAIEDAAIPWLAGSTGPPHPALEDGRHRTIRTP